MLPASRAAGAALLPRLLLVPRTSVAAGRLLGLRRRRMRQLRTRQAVEGPGGWLPCLKLGDQPGTEWRESAAPTETVSAGGIARCLLAALLLSASR